LSRLAGVVLGAALALSGASTAGLAQAANAPPEPPRRPGGLGAVESAPASAGGPLRLTPEAVAPRPSQPPGAGSAPQPGTAQAGALSEQEAVDRVNRYLNSFRTLIADFVQIGADGRRYEGKLYIDRPGRMRFEYRPPATIEVISDGTTVAVRDRRLATQDNYLIGQTPLKFLLKEQIDLRKDVKVTRVSSTPDAVRVTIEDRATLGGTSRITLHYDPRANVLRQWIILDPQGYETNVQVANLDTGRKPDPGLFRINLERVIDTNR
jgi:outer membrane lipoprotein-sorting protein